MQTCHWHDNLLGWFDKNINSIIERDEKLNEELKWVLTYNYIDL